jgi:hypothetical protein
MTIREGFAWLSRPKHAQRVTLLACAAIAASVACSGSTDLIVPSGGASVPTSFGSCSVVNGYAAVSSQYCEKTVTCHGAYYALCDGSAWSACACAGAWLMDTSYSKVDKPDFGAAPGGSSDGGGDVHYVVGPGGNGGGGGGGGSGAVCGPEAGSVTPPPACYGTDPTKCCGAYVGDAMCVSGQWMCGGAPGSGCNGTVCPTDGGGG